MGQLSWIGFLDAPQNLPAPNMKKVQPWRVSMNAEKISRPFAALPLEATNTHGPLCISTLQQGRIPAFPTPATRHGKIPCRIIRSSAFSHIFHERNGTNPIATASLDSRVGSIRRRLAFPRQQPHNPCDRSCPVLRRVAGAYRPLLASSHSPLLASRCHSLIGRLSSFASTQPSFRRFTPQRLRLWPAPLRRRALLLGRRESQGH